MLKIQAIKGGIFILSNNPWQTQSHILLTQGWLRLWLYQQVDAYHENDALQMIRIQFLTPHTQMMQPPLSAVMNARPEHTQSP